ncbi:hypothetical protein A7K94_0201525 [Modestobacter sp. VKM Ac-2676]|nr:hypothetical protein A7K94_0201525 [Modestobacter sp. VKM Ac-2676]
MVEEGAVGQVDAQVPLGGGLVERVLDRAGDLHVLTRLEVARHVGADDEQGLDGAALGSRDGEGVLADQLVDRGRDGHLLADVLVTAGHELVVVGADVAEPRGHLGACPDLRARLGRLVLLLDVRDVDPLLRTGGVVAAGGEGQR